MKTAQSIPANDFCRYHDVEYAFINLIKEAGLIEVTLINEILFIPDSEVPKLEKIVSLHHLDINIPGIEAITHLLGRMEQMQERIQTLHNRLKMYEDE
ncbi:MAG TPA: chaperone modulator CbpM [Mucilaginibacter sp.]